MELTDVLGHPADRSATVTGVVTGLVTNNNDPDKLGRVKVTFPWLSDDHESAWARIAVLMAGDQRGTYFLPEVGDEVLVAFEHGDMRFPYVLGALWHGGSAPPESSSDRRVIKSRSGHTIVLDDGKGKETISIVDHSGSNSIVISSTDNSIKIEAAMSISITCTGTLKLSAPRVEIG